MRLLYTIIRRYTSKVLVYILCFGLVMFLEKRVEAQAVYANSQFNNTTSAGLGVTVYVTLPDNAVNTTYTDSSRLNASSTLGSGTAYLQMVFNGSTLPANTVVYIKYKNVSGALLGGGISLQAYSGSSNLLIGSTVTTTSSEITTPDGTKYFAVSSPSSFNAVRVTVTSPAALGTTAADIFYAFYETAGTGCGAGFYTTTNISGIGIASITNPSFAIDANLSTPSSYSVALGVAATLYQNVYFPNLSTAGDAATVSLSIPSSLISLGLLGSTTVTAYKGTTSVATYNLSSLLQGTDILGLLQSGAVSKISLVPTDPFNRIEVAMTSLAGVATSLNLYEVERTPPKPTFTLLNNDTVKVCYGTAATMVADNPALGNELVWYANAIATDTTVLHTGTSYLLPFNSIVDTVFWVASRKTGCAATSERVPVRVLVNTLPTMIFNSPVYGCHAQTSFLFPYTSTTNSPTSYSIVWSAAAGLVGFQPVVAAALPTSPLSIMQPITAQAGSYTGSIIIKNNNTCANTYPFTLIVQDPPVVLPVTTFQ